MSFNKEVSYDSLVKSARHYQGEKGFCSVIALAIATGCKFGKARSIMKKEGLRNSGRGASTYGIEKAFNSLGKTLVEFTPRRGFMVKNAAKFLPSVGTYIIYSSAHVTCMKDGVIQDWVMIEGSKGKKMQQVLKVV